MYAWETDEPSGTLRLWVRQTAPEPYYVCGGCGISVRDIHSWTERQVRDLSWGTWQVWLVVEVHRVRCRRCGVRTERLPFTAGKGLRRAAARNVLRDRQCGAVTLIQRFGSSLNLNVHIHSLVLDGVFSRSTPTAVPVFHALPAPTGDEVAQILERVHGRALRLFRRRGRLPEAESSPSDSVAEQLPLAGFASASIQGLVARGPRAGQPVRRLRSAAASVDPAKPRCARLAGFSLHANVAVPAHARERREHVCRYLLRAPLALERLTASSHGPLLYELAHPRADGAPPVLLDPLELLEQLSVLIPLPRRHTLRYHGVLAPHAAWRSQIIPRPSEGAGQEWWPASPFGR